MRARCLNPRHQSFARYGGRGIAVCERWLESFESFLADMGLRPHGADLDRIDNDAGYSPSNCRWATRKENSRNRRSRRVVDTPDGQMLLCEAAERYGLKAGTIARRIAAGWPVDRVFLPRL